MGRVSFSHEHIGDRTIPAGLTPCDPWTRAQLRKGYRALRRRNVDARDARYLIGYFAIAFKDARYERRGDWL